MHQSQNKKMCETLNPQSPFDVFLECWCRKTGKLEASEKRKRAYYWSWNSHNWYPTLCFLAFRNGASVPVDLGPESKTAWYAWDPTPISFPETGVSRQEFDRFLNPDQEPWDQYPNVCQSQKQELDWGPFLALFRSKGTQCVICQEAISIPEMHNALYKEFQSWSQIRGLNPETWETKKQFLDSERSRVPGHLQPLFPWVSRDDLEKAIAEFFQQGKGTHGVTMSPILVPKCAPNATHPMHESCLCSWYQVKGSYLEQLMGQTHFVPLRQGNAKNKHQGLQPSNALGVCSCPACRVPIHQVAYPELERPNLTYLPVSGSGNDYNLEPSPPNAESNIGPYRLVKGALVYYYPMNSFPGSPFAGIIGRLNRVVPDSELPEMEKWKGQFGNCLAIEPLFPKLKASLDLLPVAGVFDFAFFQLDLLPSRDDLQSLFSRTIREQLVSYTHVPEWFTENVGILDLAHSQLSPAPAQKNKDRIAAMESQMGPFWLSQIQKWVADHQKYTTSPLIPDTRAPIDSAFVRRLLLCMGYYQSFPNPRRLHLPSQAVLSVLDVASLVRQQEAALSNVKVTILHLYVWTVYAFAGWDVLPEASPAFVTVVRGRFPKIPSVLAPLLPPTLETTRIPEYSNKDQGKRKHQETPTRRNKKPKSLSIWEQNLKDLKDKLALPIGERGRVESLLREMQLDSVLGLNLHKQPFAALNPALQDRILDYIANELFNSDFSVYQQTNNSK